MALLVGVAGIAMSADTDPDGRLFEPSTDALADVQQTLERAKANDRLALIVVGGNWCHDSRALAARLNRSPLAEVIEQEYELVYVDVGWLDQGRDVLQEFGVAHFYATPTVLIVDPVSGNVVNDEDRHIWGNAYKVDMAQSVAYFETWATADLPTESTDSPELQQLNADIDAFELQLAERVAEGYEVLGPLLKEHKAGNTPDDLDAKWEELYAFRSAIPGDIQDLRDEAERRVMAGEQGIKLDYPEYAPLSWETE